MLKVNGKAYDWGDVDLKIPGLNIQVQEISYDDKSLTVDVDMMIVGGVYQDGVAPV